MAASKNNNDFFDIKALFQNYLRHWWWFVISLAVCGVCAYVWVKTHNPEYVVRANVIVSDEDETGSFTAMSGLSDLFGSTANVEDEVFVISSHSVLRDVARDLGVYKTHYVKTGMLTKRLFYPNFPVDVMASPQVLDTLMTTIDFETKVYADGTADIKAEESNKTIGKAEGVKLPYAMQTKFGDFVISKTPSFPKNKKSVKSYISISGFDIAAEDLAEFTFSDKASKKSNMIELYLNTENPEYGKDILNEIIANYNRRGIEYKNMQGEKTKAFIDDRLALITTDLSDSEHAIESYKKSAGITDVQADARYNMTMRGSAEEALIKAETESELIRLTRDFLTQPDNAYEVIPAGGSIPNVMSAVASYNALIMQRFNLMQNARGDNRQLKVIEGQIDIMRNSINTALERAYETSLVSIREARKQLSEAQSRLGNVPTQERLFLNLQRQQAVKQELYIFLLQRREETAMMIANAIPKGRIVDNAYTLSEPVGMKKRTVLLIAILIGLLLPPFILYMRSLLRNKFSDSDELKKITDVPIFGEICRDNSGRKLVVLPGENSSTSELFRMVRTQLQFMLKSDKSSHVVLVTSTRPGEGKSFVSVNLAASLAALHKRVILVGMDIRKPQLANYLDINRREGVTNYLCDPTIDPSSLILHDTVIPGCDILLAGPIPPNPSELLTSQTVDDLFARLAKDYDYIVVDSAPIGMVSDTMSLARIADLVVYVTRADYTTRRDIQFLNETVQSKKLPNTGIIVNGVKEGTGHTGYGYGYGYGNEKGSGRHHHHSKEA